MLERRSDVGESRDGHSFSQFGKEAVLRRYLQPNAGDWSKTRRASSRWPLSVCAAWRVAALLIALAASATRSWAGDIELPELDRNAPIEISADAGNRWQQGAYEVWLLRGNCRIAQATGLVECREAVVWVLRREANDDRPTKVIAYCEGQVSASESRHHFRMIENTWFGRFQTRSTAEFRVLRVSGQPDVLPPIHRRAMAKFEPSPPPAIMQTQFLSSPAGGPTIITPEAGAVPAGTRRIRAYPRSNQDVQAAWYADPQTNQWVALISSGVNLIIDGMEGVGALDIAADRLVIWTRNAGEPDLSGRRPQDARMPLEVYMEGNIVFRQGERVIYADRMYYDVANQVGTVLGAEILTPVEGYQGLLRLRSEIVQQSGEGRFFAKDAFITSSRMGYPSYRLQAGDIEFTDIQRQAVDAWTGMPLVNPETEEPVIEHQRQAVARNNWLYLGPAPILYWPSIATDLEEPSFYLRRVRVKNDSIFGTQVLTDWNAYELLGIRNRPMGTRWDISFDYLSKRGFGHGTTFSYDRPNFLGLQGPTRGLFDYWGIYDNGEDHLGSDRKNLTPEVDYRHRLLWQHRQRFENNIQLTGEVGWLSDRNFLEQYFEREWDEFKDMTTGAELKQLNGNRAWSLNADARLNPFFTETEWLPRFDHFWMGQPLFGMFTWYEHSSAGYARFRRATAPKNPNDQPFSYLPWEQADKAEGERLSTRHEIDLPLQLGPIKCTPYVLGELAHWGADLNSDDFNRAYGQAGVRATMPIWRVNPTVESQLWNVHGLAHKLELQFEFLVADASRDMDTLPLYDNLDDNSIEASRRRFLTNTFGIPSVLPPAVADLDSIGKRAFDERYYALRYGLASHVASPSTEIADDLMAMRLGLHQRWQTKRGLPGARRIIDWITFDTNMTVFPETQRDNYGKAVGLWDYDFRWHVGDRTTVVSDGIFDFFQDGQQIATVGVFFNRPPRGSLFVGMRFLEGPMQSHTLSASYSYWMSPKWVSTFGTSIDFAKQGNLGQSFTLTRIGESLLVSAGFNVDPIRGDFGVGIAVEPRFLPKGRLNSMTGARIPPAGAFGLE